MVAVCTLSTINSLNDLKVFLFTLALFNEVLPTIYLLCDTETAKFIEEQTLYKGEIIVSIDLDKYGTVNRQQMIYQRGINYKTLWDDFMMEKATVIDLAFQKEDAIFFFDSDICFMGQLPQIPENAKLGLSQHMIKPVDENRYGKYNAGYLWTNDKSLPEKWRQATKTSRFHDQTALEDVAKVYNDKEIHNFSIQNNYGWWRMYQSTESVNKKQKSWTIFCDNSPCAGIYVDGHALLSVHTHWDSQDFVTKSFNQYIIGLLTTIDGHKSANALKKFIHKLINN
jgi:hypothetical protein